jgi:hypothetical protein
MAEERRDEQEAPRRTGGAENGGGMWCGGAQPNAVRSTHTFCPLQQIGEAAVEPPDTDTYPQSKIEPPPLIVA